MFTETFNDSYSWGTWTNLYTSYVGDPYLYAFWAEQRLTTGGAGGAGSILFSYRWTDHNGVLRTESGALAVGVYGPPQRYVMATNLVMGSGQDFEFKLEYDHTGQSVATGFVGDLKMQIARLEGAV